MQCRLAEANSIYATLWTLFMLGRDSGDSAFGGLPTFLEAIPIKLTFTKVDSDRIIILVLYLGEADKVRVCPQQAPATPS